MRWYRALVTTAITFVGLVTATAAGCGRSGDVQGTTGAGGTNTTSGGGGVAGGGLGPDVTNFEACAEETATATLSPVSMFIAVDKSGSMMDNGKWDAARAAFTAFFQDPAAGSLNVALRFWPDDGCDENTCDVVACSTPQAGPELLSDPMHQQALIALFQQKMPGGNTPISAALEGAVAWGQNYLTSAQPGETVVIILVTDGEPNGCDEDIGNISAIAAGALSSDNILTYAVGLQGSAEPDMNAIATAGGTNMGIFIGNANAQQELLDALLTIAGQSVNCSFAVPQPSDPNEQLDPRLVRVEYGQMGMGSPTLLTHVADASACGSGGWYYDDNANPTTITFCPETCATVQADTLAQVDIALGCECETDADCDGNLICVDHKCVPPCDENSCLIDEICLDSRCVPAPGDPCEEDVQCPEAQSCIGGQCSYGGIVVGPFEAVQGGAFNCTVASTMGSPSDSTESRGLGWLAALLGLTVAARRRRRTR